jgi:hypothetical protein
MQMLNNNWITENKEKDSLEPLEKVPSTILWFCHLWKAAIGHHWQSGTT